MLARARKTIKRFDFNQRNPPRACRNPALTLRMVHKLTRASVTQRLDLIRIRLLRSQLEELYKIKNLLERKIDEQQRFDEEQRKFREELKSEEAAAVVEAARKTSNELNQQRHLNNANRQADTDYHFQRMSQQTIDTKMIREDSREDDENAPPLIYYTPESERKRKESRCVPIMGDEQHIHDKQQYHGDDDDLIPDIKSTPSSRSYPRQSIGQWSVERARNNMSVRSLVTSLEFMVGPTNSRSRK